MGFKTIKGITYPLKSDIKIIVENSTTNKHEEYNFKNDSLSWGQSIKSLEEDDKVTITVSADGWIGTDFQEIVY